jgi:hypothetical protein
MSEQSVEHLEYKKTSLVLENKDIDKRFTLNDKGKVAKSDEEINKNCELQLDGDNFEKLRNKLTERLKNQLNEYDQTENKSLNTAQISVKKALDAAYDKLKDSKKVLDDFSNSYDIIEKSKTTNLTNKLSRMDQTSVTNTLDVIKTKLKAAKETIDKLNGSLVSKSVFKDTETALDSLKKGTVKNDNYINNVDLGFDITGYVYTFGGLRITGRNIKGEKCTVTKVNAKTKEYTVLFENGKAMTISQNNLCLVNDEKNKAES